MTQNILNKEMCKDFVVLLVEDDERYAVILMEILELYFDKVILANNGLEGWNAYLKHSPSLIISDIDMPKMNGIEMSKKIKEVDKAVPIIITSAYSNADYIIELINIGISRFLLKPLNVSALINIISEIVFFRNKEMQVNDYKKHLEEEIAKKTNLLSVSEEKFKIVINNSPEAIITTDEKSNIVLFNQGAENLFGYKADEILTKPLSSIIPEKINLINGATSNEPSSVKVIDNNIEIPALKKDGNIVPIEITFCMYQINSKTYLTLFARDMTKRKEIEKQLFEYTHKLEELAEERAKQLIHADRLATIGTMTASIAHEINNPVTFISGNSQTLEMYWEVIEPILQNALNTMDTKAANQLKSILVQTPKAFTGISQGVDRVSSIVNNLKLYSSTNRPNNHKFNLEKTINDAVYFCTQPLKKSNCLILHNMNGLNPEFIGNSQHFEQIFTNLIINSIDAMQHSEVKKIEIDVKKAGNDRVQITYSDSGPGIKEELLDKIFDPFFTTKAEGKGTGLGLSIVQKLVKSYNGQIAVANKPESGVLFSLIFPIL